MEILSVLQIWDSYYGRDRMQTQRTVQDDQGNIRTEREVYYYTVYDQRARIQEETIKQPTVDVRA